MLDALKFVQGAVAKKDFLPAMTHFVIENGFVRSFNGTLALCSKIPLNLDCKPKADQFIKAISNCNDVVSLAMTPAGRLKVASGKFKAFVDCINEETLHVEPEGERGEFDSKGFYKAIQILAPIIGDDVLRAWSTGVLFKGKSAFATNNIIVVEYWTGVEFPVTVNVPRAAIREILRLGKPPIYAQVTKTSITFHFDDAKWIRWQLLETSWPDLSKVLDAPCVNEPIKIQSELFDALDYLRPFADKLERVYFKDGVASTTNVPEEGAYYDVPFFPYNGIYSISMLNVLESIVNAIDF